jgi:hypothetical protein
MLACCAAIIPERETGREPVEAIRIAQGLGMPLKITAKVDPFDEGYFREGGRAAIGLHSYRSRS